MEILERTELCFPELLNTSCRKLIRPQYEIMIAYILMSCISLVTVTLNLLVIISISHFKQLHTPTNLLLLSLAVSDFLVGFLMCFQILLLEGCWFLGDLMCAVYFFLAYMVTFTSAGIMVFISVDRYVAICDPLRYPTKITQKRLKICVCLGWLFSVTAYVLLLKDNMIEPGKYNSCIGECVIVLNFIEGVFDMLLYFIIPVTVIIVLYMRVFVVAVSQARAMRSHVVVSTKHPGKKYAKKSELKAARTLGIVVIVFLICICPYFCIALT
ncbi:hypothetical protein LDENG_00208680, partial [Lucifuga dentata]